MLLIGLSNTPLVESGPTATTTYLLECISTVCGGVAMACKSLSLNCRIIEQGWLEIIRVIDTLLVYLIILHCCCGVRGKWLFNGEVFLN